MKLYWSGWSLPMAATAALLASGCYHPWTSIPAPERALASEGDSVDMAPIAATTVLTSGHLVGPSDDAEPDLAPELESGATEADEHADPTPGEGLPQSDKAAASRYASLDRTTCERELDRRHVSYERVGEARGVIAPLRLRGPLSGVTFRSNLSAKQRETATIEIYDCRLVLALDDFAKILQKRDIVEVVHLSVYRPVSSKVRLKGAGRRHSGALAIDAAIFKTKDGKTLNVEKDFHGRIGKKPCPTNESSPELQKIACEASAARLFNVLLTPDYNWAHRNHFHLEVTANVPWTLVR